MIPHADEYIERWRLAREQEGRLLVALDFDGTLAPIRPRPEEATLPDDARAALEALTRRRDTDLAIISGRALEDLRERVAIDGIFYAGNHGLEIEGPGIEEMHQEAALAQPRISLCAERLRSAMRGVEGVIVEDKGLTLSVHYRLAAEPDAVDRIRAEIQGCLEEMPGLTVTSGKMVLEVRPDVEWDKGRATEFLLNVLEADLGIATPAIFIGDDRTDEDAFRALRRRGDGVIVASSPPSDTAATTFVHSPAEVVSLLLALAADT